VKRFTPGMVAAVLLAFFTFSAAGIISRTIFERLPHLEDEFAYLYQAKVFAGGHAWVPRDEPVKIFWQPFVIQPETAPDGIQKRFGKYTPGWPLLLSVGVAFGQPWIVNALLSMLSVALVYRMGREIFSEPVGLVSALLLAISPMALLLNATFMSHASAMFMSILFVYGYWRLMRNGRRRYVWAIVSGLALGWIISTRPLTAVAIAAPVILHAISRVLDSAFSKNWRRTLGPTLLPLIVLSVAVLPTGGLWPLFNQIWTGDWRTNTYTMLWSYDTVGFGPGHGIRGGGHTLEYGWENARADVGVWLRDLFVFTLDPTLAEYAKANIGWGAGVGLSWILVVAGLIAGRKSDWIWLFFEMFIAIVIAQMTYWIGSVVYGGAAYSLRYYYEATFGVCIVAGYGAVAWARSLKKLPEPSPLDNKLQTVAESVQPTVLAQAVPLDYLNGVGSGRSASLKPPVFSERLSLAWKKLWPGYVLIFAACLVSLFGYTPARFKEPLPGWTGGLFRYNQVGLNQIDTINEMRASAGQPNQPVLIVVLRDPNPKNEDNWRDYGAAMAKSSPYLDGDIIVARVFDKDDAPEVVQRFPGRLVLYQIGEGLYFTVEEAIASATTRSKIDTSVVQ
jgi:uncharacterized membrane protein